MRTISLRLLSAPLAAAAALCLAVPATASDDSYGYFRVIEGSATVVQTGSGDAVAAEINQPVLSGDRLAVGRGSRLELVLSDRNLLRVDGGAELVFERLAGSPDTNDRATVLRLLDGEIQLVVRDERGDAPRIDTPNATVYAQAEGTYRVETQNDDFTHVVVRNGYAEVVTERGSAVVRGDEEAWVEGLRDAHADVQAAGARDALERWADRLDDEARGDRYAYLDDDLRYEGSYLSRHGSWVSVGGSYAWRPRVSVGWRPYWHGRWAHTRGGLFWVSYEPWGWVPYHYGTWDYVPAYGWVWYPGNVFAPAWVYWYWGPSYVGWCPVGYYTRWYGHHYPGFSFGVHGWIHGDWGLYSHWSFVPHGHFGRRDLDRFVRTGHDLRDTRPGGLGRGILTTDTRDLTPDRWGDPGRAREALERRVTVRRTDGGGLPDVTPFVERRRRELPPEVLTRVVTDRPEAPEGSPLRPTTLGSPRVAPRGGDGEAGTGRRVVTVEPRGPEAGDSGRGDRGDRGTVTIEPRSPRTAPSPPADSGDESWRVRGRGDGEASRPRAVPARPAGEAGAESWRVRGRGDADAPRAVPSRPAEDAGGTRVRPRTGDAPRATPAPPADSGDESWRVRGRDDDGAQATPSRPADEGRDEGRARVRERDEDPPAASRSHRYVTPDRGSSAGEVVRPRVVAERPTDVRPQARPAPERPAYVRPEVRSAPDRRTYVRPEVRPAPQRPTSSRPEVRSAPSPSRPEVRSAPSRPSPRSEVRAAPRDGDSGSSGRSVSPRSSGSRSNPPARGSRGRGRDDG